jgi:hypothetical protein
MSSITEPAVPSGDSDVETARIEILAEMVEVETASVDGHFFEDLGAHSIVMAHFCARVRKQTDLPSVSMKDVFRQPAARRVRNAAAGSSHDRQTIGV